MNNVISFYTITKKEHQKWLKAIGNVPPPPPIDDNGFWDSTGLYVGKLAEAMRKYGSFKGRKNNEND